MTIRQLEIFTAIVETGRFTTAAQKMYVAQPSVSQQIRLLEEELGERLFVRLKNRKVHLTEAGRLLHAHAEAILRQCQVARMEIAALTKEPTEQIRIGIGGHQLTSMLPPALSAFHGKYPKICVDVMNGTSPQIIELLKTNRLDLGIVNFPIQARELRAEVLFTEELVLVLRKANNAAMRRIVDAAQIAELPLILYDQSTSTRKRLDAFFRQFKITPRITFELSSVEGMKSMVRAGLGATIIPYSAVLLDSHDDLCVQRLRGKPLTRSVGAAMPNPSNMPLVMETMLLLIKQRFREIENLLSAVNRKK